MSLPTLAKALIGFGITLIVVGVLIYLLSKTNIPVGKLPGDIVIKRGNLKVYFPVVTSIILSILLTIGLNIVLRYFNK